jgi:hypothetical protein
MTFKHIFEAGPENNSITLDSYLQYPLLGGGQREAFGVWLAGNMSGNRFCPGFTETSVVLWVLKSFVLGFCKS